jgi:hypothetical protein
MNKNDGWGAFQNMKKENQTLKKGIVVQNENSFGERIYLDKYNNFKNISSRVNPFRFSDSIKNDVLEKEYSSNIFKKEENEEKKEEKEEKKEEDENEYEVYKNLIIKKQKQVDEILNENINYKNELENKIKILEEEYKLNILNNNTKISKIQTHIDNLQKIIETNDENLVIPEKNIKVPNIVEDIPENIVLKPDETNSKKTNKNRPETIKGCFNTNTIIRHKKKGFQEFCIYIVNEGCLFRCDQNGIYNENSIKYNMLYQFTSDNYKKNSPNRTERNNAYAETEYLCKISNKFLPLIDLQKGTIYN